MRVRFEDHHPAYVPWKGMMTNCGLRGVPRDGAIKYYISRGITVCPAWQDFSVFESWLLAQGWEPRCRMTVCRKDKTKGFSPENCIVCSQAEAQNYKSNIYRVNGRSIRDILGLKGYGKADKRLRSRTKERCSEYGWDVGDAVREGVMAREDLGKSKFSKRDTGFRREFRERKPLYAAWMGILSRRLPVGWKDYEAFEEWALSNGWKSGLMVTRKDKEQGFGPENCVIVPYEVAVNMRRNTRRVDGKCLRELIGEPTRGRGDRRYKRIFDRVFRRGYDVESALMDVLVPPEENGRITARIVQEKRASSEEGKAAVG